MTAADVLTLLAKLNLAAAVAIILVLALRPLVRPRLGARFTYASWLLPLVAMLASLLPARRMVVQVSSAMPSDTGLAVAQTARLSDFLPALPAETVTAILDPFQLALGLWIAGAVAAVWKTAHAQWRFTREAAGGGIGPAVIGVISPRIITPRDFATRFDPEEQSLVLAHEQVHIRRQDLRLNALATAIRCLFWFNPLVHLATRYMRIDQELACDEAVITRFPEARFTYVRALVKSQLANRPLPLGCYWPSGTQHPFLERIAMLKKANVGRKRRLSGAAALGALCAASAVAAWAANPARIVYEPAAPSPVAEIAAAPLAEVPAPQPPAPAAAPRPADPAPAPPAEVCLTNACADAPAVVAAPEVAEICDSPCRITNIGAKLIPQGRAFATYFDGNAPVLIKGKIVDMMLRDDGISSEFVVEHNENGKITRWRAVGGTSANMPADVLAAWRQAVGQEVVVKGYQTHDKSCVGGCIANVRDVTRADGSKIGVPAAQP